MRIRTIKPAFCQSLDIARLSEAAALTAALLPMYADDEGYFVADDRLIKANLFPLRDLSRSITVVLRELSDVGFVEVRQGSDGRPYGRVVKFAEHQVINKPTPSKIAPFWQSAQPQIPGLFEESDNATGTLPERYGSTTDGKGKERNKEKERNNTSSTQASTVCFFEDFWNVYPKKVERKNALAIWKRKRLDTLAEMIVADVQRRVDSDKWRAGFIPNPTTYLNGERWDDALDAAQPGPRENSGLSILEGITI